MTWGTCGANVTNARHGDVMELETRAASPSVGKATIGCFYGRFVFLSQTCSCSRRDGLSAFRFVFNSSAVQGVGAFFLPCSTESQELIIKPVFVSNGITFIQPSGTTELFGNSSFIVTFGTAFTVKLFVNGPCPLPHAKFPDDGQAGLTFLRNITSDIDNPAYYPVYGFDFLPDRNCVKLYVARSTSSVDVINDGTISITRITASTDDLVITKDDCVADVSAGTTYTYAINVTNTNSNIALDVTVRDVWPTLAYSIINVSSACTVSGGSQQQQQQQAVVCRWDQIPAGASVQATITYSVRSNVPAGTMVTNCASVSTASSAVASLNEGCDTNRVVAAPPVCLPYNSICVAAQDCCSPLLCLRHASVCGNQTGTVFRCSSKGGFTQT